MMHFYKKQQSGFSLVETLVAISILLIVIVGPMSISSRTAKSSSFASEQIQAFYLAQEGMELTQKLRDDFLLEQFRTTTPSATIWTDFKASNFYTTCAGGAGCGLEWSNLAGKLSAPVSCSPLSNCKLKLATTNNRSHFTLGDGDPTPFTRVIYFDTTGLDADREVRVRSVVTWRTGSIVADQSIQLETYLYNTYDSQ